MNEDVRVDPDVKELIDRLHKIFGQGAVCCEAYWEDGIYRVELKSILREIDSIDRILHPGGNYVLSQFP